MAVGGALVALAGCAAQPSSEQKVPAAAVTPPAVPVAEKPIDFHTLQETKCPTSATSYQQWVAKFQSYALSTGRPDQVIQTAFVGVKKNTDVSDRQAKQPEFEMPVWTYLDRVASQERISRGQEKYQQNKALLAAIEKDYGVPPEIIMGIWGIETDFGNNFGDYNVFEALSNLGFGANRHTFACEQLLAALDMVDKRKVAPTAMVGSWAGAMGHPQFLPSNYLNLAVDRDGSGTADLWNSVPDGLASAANHLVDDGWQRGLPWGLQVKLPANFPYAEAELDQFQPVAYWQQKGVTRIDGSALPNLPGGVFIIVPGGHSGPAFLGSENFDIIRKYNNSIKYVLAVGHLGERVLGGRQIAGTWPVNEPPLSLADREEVQTLLNARGYDTGGIDGRLGVQSRKAARLFQKEIGWVEDGFITKALLDELRKRKNA